MYSLFFPARLFLLFFRQSGSIKLLFCFSKKATKYIVKALNARTKKTAKKKKFIIKSREHSTLMEISIVCFQNQKGLASLFKVLQRTFYI